MFGFLDAAGAVDLAATEALIHAVSPLPWTFHRAVDHAADVQAAWRAVRLLPNLATVLTSGSPTRRARRPGGAEEPRRRRRRLR